MDLSHRQEGLTVTDPLVADWYFDFVSPYSWFGLNALNQLPDQIAVRPRPILFAALLKHFGQKGPAEITAKRQWTYRQCVWWADRHGIDFRLPAAHPFNPVPYLRLALILDCRHDAIERIFRAIWTSGKDAGQAVRVEAMCREFEVDPARLQSLEIKNQLRKLTSDAIARGVFGVPTLRFGDAVFWGVDAMPMVLDYLDSKPVFGSEQMRGAHSVPVGVIRKA